MSFISRSKSPGLDAADLLDQLPELENQTFHDHDHKHDHGRTHEHADQHDAEHQHHNETHSELHRQIHIPEEFDFQLETLPEACCEIRSNLSFDDFSLDELETHQETVQNSIDLVSVGSSLLSSVSGVFGSFLTVMSLGEPKEKDCEVHKEAHGSLSQAIDEFQLQLTNHQELGPDGAKQSLELSEELQEAIERAHEIAEKFKGAAADTNRLIQHSEFLRDRRHDSVKRECQRNTDEFTGDIEGLDEHAEQLLRRSAEVALDPSLSEQERAEQLAQLAEEAELDVASMEKLGKQFQNDTEELVERSELPQEQQFSLLGKINSYMQTAYTAARELWQTVDQTLRRWARASLGDRYDEYLNRRESIGKLLQNYENERYAEREIRRARKQAENEQSSLYTLEQSEEKEEDPDRPTTTVDRVYEDYVPVMAKLRRFVEYIALVLPMPFSEHDRDYRQRRALNEEREHAKDVDQLLGKKLIKGIDDAIPQHERLTRFDGWRIRFRRRV